MGPGDTTSERTPHAPNSTASDVECESSAALAAAWSTGGLSIGGLSGSRAAALATCTGAPPSRGGAGSAAAHPHRGVEVELEGGRPPLVGDLREAGPDGRSADVRDRRVQPSVPGRHPLDDQPGRAP
ncbi:hypothetical protein [Kitasatospora sp. NPDC059327]|uniref:hypothetical protein n=1 Tax=Kitasatospora sp. NPDC059327 TaxID=3346803 RepID=UPI0036CA4F42